MSNSRIKPRAISNPSSGILSPGSLASVPQKDVWLVLGLKRLAQSSLLSRGRHCLQYGLPFDVRELNIIPFRSRARYTTMLALSSLECGNWLSLNSTPSHSTPTALSSQNQSLRWFLLSFSQPADPYLASLGDSLSICWQATVNQGH